MKKHIKTLFLGIVPVLAFTLLISCVEDNLGKEIETASVILHETQEVTSETIKAVNNPILAVEIKTDIEKEKVVEIKKTKKKLKENKEVITDVVPVEPKKLVEEQVVIKEVEKELNVVSLDHSIWDKLLKKHVSSSGKVNYKSFKLEKSQLLQYIGLLKSNAPNSDWSKNEKIAYWINVYNVFTVKLIVDNYPLKSITNLDKPWDKKFIEINGVSYSLGDVENNILRKMGESRIHFAINCASVSCPKLLNEAFTGEKLNAQLRSVTKSFFSDVTKNQLTDGDLKISKLFEWYAADFSKGNIIAYINKYSGHTVSINSKISYLEYNWNLNE